MKRLWLLSAMVAMVLVLAGCGAAPEAVVISPAITELASCLTTNGATFYGTEWCPHCKDQKKLFGDAMVQVNYIDCDKNAPACQSAGVQGYPTWVFADGSTLVWAQALEALAAKTGCSFAPEALIPEAQAQEAIQASGM